MSFRPARPLALRALLPLAASALLLLAACGGAHPALNPGLPSVGVTRAERGPISLVVSGEAELFAYNQATLSPKISSPIHLFLVNRGQRVRKGQLLATLENRDLQAAVSQAQGAVEQAQANYAITTAADVPQKLLAAETALKNAQANLDAQQTLYDNRLALYNEGAIAGKELDQARVALTQAKTERETAHANLEQTRKTVAAQPDKSARGQLDAARAARQAAQVQLHYTELRSPIDGVVAYRNLYPGDIAPAGTVLLTVMDISRVIAKLHLPQNKAVLLKIGDSATLLVDGIGDLPGKVSVLSPALDPNSTTSEVWVEAANPKSELQPGRAVGVSIVAKTVPDAVIVPSSAVVTQEDGSIAVIVVNPDHTVRAQAVQLGIENGGWVQIVSGIAAGDMVITSGGYGLPDGTKVEPKMVEPSKPGLAPGAAAATQDAQSERLSTR